MINLFEDIIKEEQWITIKKIDKGWSSDLKYYIETESNKKLLLRISKIENYEYKKKEYERIRKYALCDIEMSQPLDFGTCKQGVYMLLTWISGEDLSSALLNVGKSEQYRLGRMAGKILKEIHSIEILMNKIPENNQIINKKLKIESYKNSNVRIINDSNALKFIDENIDKIGSFLPVYQHGDFHPGNLILTASNEIGVIDFNRSAVGDPYEEFYKLESFGIEVSIPFCIGQIDGYFNDEIPESFWDILAVYVAHASLYSIKWAEAYGQVEIDKMIKRCSKTFENYNNFTVNKPVWYTNENYNDIVKAN